MSCRVLPAAYDSSALFRQGSVGGAGAAEGKKGITRQLSLYGQNLAHPLAHLAHRDRLDSK